MHEGCCQSWMQYGCLLVKVNNLCGAVRVRGTAFANIMRERASLQTRRVPHERGQKAAGTRIMRRNAILGFTCEVRAYVRDHWKQTEVVEFITLRSAATATNTRYIQQASQM